MKFIFTLLLLLTLVSCNEGISFPKDTQSGSTRNAATDTTLKLVGFDQNILVHGDGTNVSFIQSDFETMSEYLLIKSEDELRTLPLVASRNFDDDVVRIYHVETGKSVLVAEDVWDAEDFAEFGNFLFFVVERVHPVTFARNYVLYKSDGTLAGTTSLILPGRPAVAPFIQGRMAYYPVGGATFDLHRVNLENMTFSVIKTNQASVSFHPIYDAKSERKALAVGTSIIDLATGFDYTIADSIMEIRDARFENNAWKMVVVSSTEREMLITTAGQNINEEEMTGPADYMFFSHFIRGGFCYFDTLENLYCNDDSTQENFRVHGYDVEIFEILGTQYICSSVECHIRVAGLSSHFVVPWRIASSKLPMAHLTSRGGRGYIINDFDGTDYESTYDVFEFTKSANHTFLESGSALKTINKYFKTKNGRRLYLIRQLGIAV